MRNFQKKTAQSLFISGCFLVLLCCNEQTPFVKVAYQPANEMALNHAAKKEADDIVRKSIDTFGGWDTWAAKKTLTYMKITQSYDSSGKILKETRQLHQYQLRPLFKAHISWQQGDDKYLIVYNGQQAWKLKNGKEMTEENDRKQAYNSPLGSHYVMCMPFKLTDPGTVINSEGMDTLTNKKVVKTVKTTYLKGAGSAAGKHTWWYFFDPQSGNLIANFLDYGDGYNFTEYTEFITVGNVKVSKMRKSYATNKDREIKHLTDVYTNEDIVFDKPLDDKLFEPLKNN